MRILQLEQVKMNFTNNQNDKMSLLALCLLLCGCKSSSSILHKTTTHSPRYTSTLFFFLLLLIIINIIVTVIVIVIIIIITITITYKEAAFHRVNYSRINLSSPRPHLWSFAIKCPTNHESQVIL